MKSNITKARAATKQPYPSREEMVNFLIPRGLSLEEMAYWSDDTLRDGYDFALEQDLLDKVEQIQEERDGRDARRPPKARMAVGSDPFRPGKKTYHRVRR